MEPESWLVELVCRACSALVPPLNWTGGSSDPPLRTTFLDGGQGVEEAGFSAEFVAGSAVEQFGVACFLR